MLNTRDPDSWLVSMEKTLYVLMSWKSMDYIGPFDPVSDILDQPYHARQEATEQAPEEGHKV